MITVQNMSLDPFYNQAFEEFVFKTFRDEDVFYLWQNKPVVVVGSYQNICREVHVESLRKRNIPVVRRISGGGTVYHDLGNINYTYISRQEWPVDYSRCLEPVIMALNSIGIPAYKNNICDINIGDQKISGSAQMAAGGRILHHGTLLFQSDLTTLDQITTQHKNDCFQSKGTISAICPVTNISKHLPKPMTLAEFKKCVLEQILPNGRQPVLLTNAQENEVECLRKEKYCSWEWTWGKTPNFIYKRNGLFAGVPIYVSYETNRGIVSGAIIECDAVNGKKAAQYLNGARLDPEGFAEICRALTDNNAEELMNLLL